MLIMVIHLKMLKLIDCFLFFTFISSDSTTHSLALSSKLKGKKWYYYCSRWFDMTFAQVNPKQVSWLSIWYCHSRISIFCNVRYHHEVTSYTVAVNLYHDHPLYPRLRPAMLASSHRRNNVREMKQISSMLFEMNNQYWYLSIL